MNGTRFLIDTNILIYVFIQNLSPGLTEKISHIFEESFVISVINKIEFLGWKEASAEEYRQAVSFLSNARILPLNETVAEKTVKIKRDVNIKLPDAVIAATCLVNNLELLTRNVKDFKAIHALTVFNPLYGRLVCLRTIQYPCSVFFLNT